MIPAGRVARHRTGLPAVREAGGAADRRRAVGTTGRWPLPPTTPSARAAARATAHAIERGFSSARSASGAPDPAHAIQRLARSLRDPLARALGVNPEALAETLLRQPAEVWASAGEVVVVFELARHPVAVRLAGLDRDPGWLPGADRRLRFVFR